MDESDAESEVEAWEVSDGPGVGVVAMEKVAFVGPGVGNSGGLNLACDRSEVGGSWEIAANEWVAEPESWYQIVPTSQSVSSWTACSRQKQTSVFIHHDLWPLLKQ